MVGLVMYWDVHPGMESIAGGSKRLLSRLLSMSLLNMGKSIRIDILKTQLSRWIMSQTQLSGTLRTVLYR